MDFFKAQDIAITRTRRLVLWFSLCVLGVIVVIYALAVVGRHFADPPAHAGLDWWDPELAMIIAPTVGGVIVLGSVFKLLQLSAGGNVVARDLGGRPVDPSTTDLLERRLLNVVEEMAIASGLAAPQVWVLEAEEGINAFAAGTDPSNAVIGVTRGCLERLNRDELQGVVAHEFSHILNGDMKLNMRLIGWIFGLVMIAMLGRMVLEILFYARGSRDSRGAGLILALAAAGVALWLVGSVGVIFARLLQAAVSRQREYLADASAVQFTRNPTGLANALKKIGGFRRNGALKAPKAAEARHLFFASSDVLKLGFATHPPLPDRIKAIDPSWDGKMLQGGVTEMFEDRGTRGRSPSRLAPATAAFAPGTLGDSARLDWRVGEIIREQLAEGHVVFRSRIEAKALLYGLLLAQDPADRQVSVQLLASRTDTAMAEHAATWSQELAGRTAAEKLALVDLSLPWLRRMTRNEAQAFIDATKALIAADGHVNPFEFMLQKVIERQIAVGLGLRPVARVRYQSIKSLAQEAAILTGAFAAISQDAAALEAGLREFESHTGLRLVIPEGRTFPLGEVAQALEKFEAATPLVKVQMLRICALVATHDGRLEDGEVELLRAAAEAIGSPVPPLTRVV